MFTPKARLSSVRQWNFPWSTGTAKLLLVLAAALALSLVPGAPKQVQAASLVLQPEESRSDILLQHRIVNQDVSPGSGALASASVRPYQSDNTVRLEAHATYCDLEGKLLGNCDTRGAHSAFARGEL